MRGLTILLLVAVASVTSIAKSDSIGRVIVKAHAAIVVIEPVPDDRRLISLPSLNYALTIEPQCATDMRAESISISVADTRKTYTTAAIDGQPVVEVTLTIPRQQIGPLAIQNFCRSDQSDATAIRILHVKEAFTAQLSLRCANDTAQSIVYASQPLDVDVQCQATDGDPASATTQDSSSDSEPR